MNQRELVTKWKAYITHVRAIQKTALQLLSHPEATQEQVWEVHLKMVALMQKHREMSPKVRAAWPRFGTFISLEDK